MNVLITGATGFIGTHLTKLVAKEGHQVLAIGTKRNNVHMFGVQVHAIPLNEIGFFCEDFEPDICINLAWYVNPVDYIHSKKNLDMMNASIALASQLAKVNCARFVGVGTCLEYDISKGRLQEDSLIKPECLYAAAKAATFFCTSNMDLKDMSFAWVRPFYIYGPYEDRRRFVPTIINSILKDDIAKCPKGNQLRDFLHVEDVASAIWAVAKSDLEGPVNIGSGYDARIDEIVATIQLLVNRYEDVHFEDYVRPPSIIANTTLLNTIWQPKYTLRSGLQQTVEWWIHHPEAS